MRDAGLYQFGVLVPDVPSIFRTWHLETEYSVWDRHYLVPDGHSLKVGEGQRVELTRRRTANGLRVEDELLRATFPLDWMALSVVERVLPRPIRGTELDGGSPQAFVDSLAFPSLPQASVHKAVEVMTRGSVTATAITARVPDWRASAVLLSFEAADAHLLRTVLAAHRFAGRPDVALDDWLREAHGLATAPPAAVAA